MSASIPAITHVVIDLVGSAATTAAACMLEVVPAGLERLVQHLKENQIPVGVTFRTPRESVDSQLEKHPALQGVPSVAHDEGTSAGGFLFQDVLGLPAFSGFAANNTLLVALQPSVDIFKAASEGGVKTLGVRLRGKADEEACQGADFAVASLFDIQPDMFGLPPFADWVDGVLPLQPKRLWKGTVIKGFGRGSKVLGIPTANLDAELVGANTPEIGTGIYIGWASVGAKQEVYKMVMSVGWNPYFDNEKKTVEPWLLHDFPEDFYDEELRLVVNGYIRPEANFSSLDALIARIHEDGNMARVALDSEPFLATESCTTFLQPVS